ncbi:MAG: DEAD/DEAH box helicase [Bryobacteraceae bacterium]|nr:DEAD/DEAH box helicase [Bryobacteraceae bacterium]
MKGLDPALASWFGARFTAYSTIQAKALPHTLQGEHVLILAPTGSGKTLAAFLSVLSELAGRARTGELPNEVLAVYVSPLRALDRDIHRNLEAPLAALNESLPRGRQIRMEVRTGDTSDAERSRQQRRRPHLLLTTPESLSSLLSQTGWRGAFDHTQAVIVDEIHAFGESKRGSLLALTLERIDPRQRIGISATAWPLEAVQRLLVGARRCAVAAVDTRRAHQLEIEGLPTRYPLAAAGYNPYRIAEPTADLVARANASLVFCSTRSATERLGLALKILLPEFEDRIEIHHGSIDPAGRLRIEDGLAEGCFKAVVCSTSLELGVDFAAVDQVLLIGAPRGVSRTLQRLGRSGHRVGGVARGSLVPLSHPDLLECIAIREAARNGRLDALRIPRAPLDVLAQALLGMAVERPHRLDEAFEKVCRAGPYLDLDRARFDAVIEYLAGGGTVLGPYGTYGKILVEGDTFRVASKAVARAYYQNVGTISDDYQVKIVGRGNRKLGEVEESFLSGLQPGEAFIIGGRSVRVKRLHADTAMVEPAEGERVRTPRWMGGKMSLTAQLALEERRLRRALRDAWEAQGEEGVERALREDWQVSREAAGTVARFVSRQNRAAPVPVDSPVQVERIRRGRTLLLIFHVVAGRAINRSLAWVLAHRVGGKGSVGGNFDDHGFVISVDARSAPLESDLRAGFAPKGWREDLIEALEKTETLGRKFRAVAEIGQLLPRRTMKGPVPRKSATWNAALLYTTLKQHEPDHPLVREAIRETLEDQLDAANATLEAARIREAPWEIFDLPRPSPFSLTLFAAFNREVLLAQDPDRALDDLVAQLYDEWEDSHAAVR